MAHQKLYKMRETELLEDIRIFELYIKSFWKVLPIPVCSTNPIFTILENGNTFNTLFQYTKDEIVGETLEMLFASKMDFEELAKKLNQRGEIFNFETIIHSKKGDEIVVLISAIARLDEIGDVVGYLFSLVDITKNKKIEQELKEQINDLETFQRLTIGRELKMIELKKRIRKLKRVLKTKK